MQGGAVFKYVCFLVTSLRWRSFRGWKADGQPNPFVGKNRARPRRTNRQELLDIFEDHGIGWSNRKPRRVVVYERVPKHQNRT